MRSAILVGVFSVVATSAYAGPARVDGENDVDLEPGEFTAPCHVLVTPPDAVEVKMDVGRKPKAGEQWEILTAESAFYRMNWQDRTLPWEDSAWLKGPLVGSVTPFGNHECSPITLAAGHYLVVVEHTASRGTYIQTDRRLAGFEEIIAEPEPEVRYSYEFQIDVGQLPCCYYDQQHERFESVCQAWLTSEPPGSHAGPLAGPLSSPRGTGRRRHDDPVFMDPQKRMKPKRDIWRAAFGELDYECTSRLRNEYPGTTLGGLSDTINLTCQETQRLRAHRERHGCRSTSRPGECDRDPCSW